MGVGVDGVVSFSSAMLLAFLLLTVVVSCGGQGDTAAQCVQFLVLYVQVSVFIGFLYLCVCLHVCKSIRRLETLNPEYRSAGSSRSVRSSSKGRNRGLRVCCGPPIACGLNRLLLICRFEVSESSRPFSVRSFGSRARAVSRFRSLSRVRFSCSRETRVFCWNC